MPAEGKHRISIRFAGETRVWSHLGMAEATKWTPLSLNIAQAAAYLRMLSPDCGTVVRPVVLKTTEQNI